MNINIAESINQLLLYTYIFKYSYIINSTVSVQQTNLLPGTLLKTTQFSQNVYICHWDISNHLTTLKLLHMVVLYVYMCIRVHTCTICVYVYTCTYLYYMCICVYVYIPVYTICVYAYVRTYLYVVRRDWRCLTVVYCVLTTLQGGRCAGGQPAVCVSGEHHQCGHHTGQPGSEHRDAPPGEGGTRHSAQTSLYLV